MCRDLVAVTDRGELRGGHANSSQGRHVRASTFPSDFQNFETVFSGDVEAIAGREFHQRAVPVDPVADPKGCAGPTEGIKHGLSFERRELHATLHEALVQLRRVPGTAAASVPT